MNNFSKKTALVLVLAIIWPNLGLAVESGPKPLKDAVSTLNETVEKLIGVKDESSTANATELEKKSRLDTFGEVLRLSFAEIEDLKNKLNDLKNETLKEEELKIKEQFLEILENHELHFKDIEKELENNLNSEKLKALAKDLKNWRADIYQPTLEKIFDFLFIFQSESLLDTAKSRSSKISSDLIKIKKSGLPTTKLQNLLNKAKTSLDQASLLTTKVRQSFKDEWLKANTSTPEITENTSSINETSTPANVNPIRVDLQRALINIKSAYQIFFEMYNIVKLLIK